MMVDERLNILRERRPVMSVGEKRAECGCVFPLYLKHAPIACAAYRGNIIGTWQRCIDCDHERSCHVKPLDTGDGAICL